MPVVLQGNACPEPNYSLALLTHSQQPGYPGDTSWQEQKMKVRGERRPQPPSGHWRHCYSVFWTDAMTAWDFVKDSGPPHKSLLQRRGLQVHKHSTSLVSWRGPANLCPVSGQICKGLSWVFITPVPPSQPSGQPYRPGLGIGCVGTKERRGKMEQGCKARQ